MTPSSRWSGILLALALLCAPVPCTAQSTRAEIDARVDERLRTEWDRAVREAAGTLNVPLNAHGRIVGSEAQIRQVFEAVLARWASDEAFVELFTPAYIQSLIDERVEARMATSVNATATNPATAGLTERSGSTSLAAIAADVSRLVSADKSAVSLNLNALAFVSLGEPELYSALRNYQRRDFARRFSGTVVFGARIPEKEITGLSNLPDFDELLDAFAWDAKVRVWGDRDPRSARWSPLTVRFGGLLTQKHAVLLSHVGTPRTTEEGEREAEDAAIAEALVLQPLLVARLGAEVRQMRERIGRSPQLSVKAAGTHLTSETGRNKYAFAALFDVGAGPSDLTVNAQYAVTNDIRFGADRLFSTKLWTLSADVTSHLAPDAMVQGRTLDWSVGASASIFQDADALPIPARNTWKLFTKVEIPVRNGGRIPVSVIYSNDPNAVSKEKHMSGLVGISYDFSALKELFGGR